jgi:DNA-binding NarL/FixJ family response regulator
VSEVVNEPTPSARTAVLLDQHPLWLDAVEEVLRRISVQVVGKTTSFDEARALIERLAPELVVAETAGPDSETNGVGWLADVRRDFPEVKVIVLSSSDDPGNINAALSLGVVAFVVKKAHPDDLAVAVRQTYEHSIYFPGSQSTPDLRPAQMQTGNSGLTPRELEILQLVAEGLSNAQLAQKLWVTEQTVKFHLSNIYRKLNVSNRTEASRWAQLHGLLPVPMRSAV